MPTRREILRRIADPLVALYGEREAANIALLAVSELAGLNPSALLTEPNAPIGDQDWDGVIARLTGGEPVQYVLGNTEFCGLRIAVRPGVLIPRPETEELVQWIVRREAGAPAVLDVGTGSGCIALAIKHLLPDTQVFAADVSDQALAIAAENSGKLNTPVTFRRADALTDLAEVFPEQFDVIVSNPPYVPHADLRTMHTNVRDHEPHEALFVPDDDPLLFYRAICRTARRMLRPGGRLYFEIYHLHADAMRTMLAEEGYTHTEVRDDFTGKPRMTCSRAD